MDRDSRNAARLRAYRLMEDLQGPDHATALSELIVLEAAVADADWPDVGFLARLGQAMDGVLGRGDPVRARQELDALVAYGEELEPVALLAHALGLRAVMHAGAGETELVLADGARGLAALELPDQPALESCTALVVLAAAYNALSLWELVEGLYDRAAALQTACEEPLQASAIAMNRVVIRLEWGSSLLEQGDVAGAREVLTRAASAADLAGRMRELPGLWRTGAASARAALRLYLDPPADPEPLVAQLADGLEALRTGDDQEMLPLTENLAAFALVRLGRPAQALSWLRSRDSASSGARSFRSWVRTQALEEGELPSEASDAHREYAAVLVAQRRDARRAVLAAANSRISGERTTAERDRLAIDVAVDPLTGLGNRRAFDGWLGRERSEPRLTAVMLVDLDDFKAVNDRYGHSAGDDVLRRVGELLARNVRPGDLAIRVGGDEFVVILETATGDQPDEAAFGAIATARAARLRDAVATADWPDLGGERFGASIGVAVKVLPAHDREAAGDLYRTADRALYAAKASLRGAAAS